MKKLVESYRTDMGNYGIQCTTQEEWDAIIKLVERPYPSSGTFNSALKYNIIYLYTTGQGWWVNDIPFSVDNIIFPASDFLEDKEPEPQIFN